MKTIWKFPVEISDCFTITMPAGAQLLSVQAQHGTACLWALVSPEARKVRRGFRVHGTGHAVSDNIGAHVGTFQLRGGDLVFHLFDQGEGPWEL